MPLAHDAANDKPDTLHADPAGHGVQVIVPLAGAKKPALQGVATDKPLVAHDEPAGQAIHEVEFPKE